MFLIIHTYKQGFYIPNLYLNDDTLSQTKDNSAITIMSNIRLIES